MINICGVLVREVLKCLFLILEMIYSFGITEV